MAAMCNWSVNLIMSETFLTLTKHLSVGGAFLLFAGFTCIAFIAIDMIVPETIGLSFTEVERMLERGFTTKQFRGKRDPKGKAPAE